MAWFDDPAIITVVLVVIIGCTIAIVYAMIFRAKKPIKQKSKGQVSTNPQVDLTGLPFRIQKSVQSNTASSAKDELRILDLEREILSDAIRRLYEAQAEGKISEVERERLAGTYKARMMSIKESISKDESIVALHELENMQEDLMRLFSDRFGELTYKVEELRSKIDVRPIKEVPIKIPSQQTSAVQIEKVDEDQKEDETESLEDKAKKKRKPAVEKPDAKTEAEKRIDSIRSEVEKVLDKLGQMEIES